MFKQKTSYYFKRVTGYKLWQENYHEHVLRNDEDVEKVIKYILHNPVRAGIVRNYYDYPYSGSLVIDNIRDLI